MSSEYVGDEFHFRLKVPSPEMPETIEVPDMPVIPDSLQKMRKEDGTWQIYEQ